MNRLSKSKLREIVEEQNSKIKKLIDERNALRSQNKSLKNLLQRPFNDAKWLDSNFRRLEREVRAVRSLLDNRIKEHLEIESEIEETEKKNKEETRNSLLK